jgi:hypothetical protein
MTGTKLKYGLITGENSKISRHEFWMNGQMWKDNGTNVTQSAYVSAGFGLDLKLSSGFSVNLNYSCEFLADTFYLSNDAVVAYIGPGSYGLNFASLDEHTPFTNKLYVEVRNNVGQFYDGNQFTINIYNSCKFGSFLSLSPSYEYDRIRFPSRNQYFNGNIAGLQALIMFNTKLSVSAQVQYSNIAHCVVTNMRLRYNPKEGNDLYIVFNEGRNIQLNRETPALDPIANRGILVKYTYTFILK